MDQNKNFFPFGLVSFVVMAVFIVVSVGQVQSQEKYPTRPVDLIIPYAPGGVVSLVYQVMAPYFTKKWGVRINLVNKPGGNTIPASLEVYDAKPDGYTLLGDNNGSASYVGAAVKTLPYKVMDRTFMAMFAIAPVAFTVPADSPFKTLKDVETEAKRSPEEFTWTSMGGTGTLDYATRQFFKAIGVDVSKTKPIMSQSGAQAAALSAGSHVKLGANAVSSAIPTIKGGMVKALAVTSKNRVPELPEVPTTAELGYPTVSAMAWCSPAGPPKLPSAIVEKWEKALEEMVKDPEVISQLQKIGALPYYLNSRETVQFVKNEIEDVFRVDDIK
jgi:tripartite-type tricarboxylate transporter receptor subunit TctC